MSLPAFTARQALVWGAGSIEQLLAAHVFIAGIGGLGCVVAEQLIRAGVGTITLLDSGEVMETDLGRQVLYTYQDIGLPKVMVAAQRLGQINPKATILTHHCKIQDAAAYISHAGAHVFADCLDNFSSRLLYEHLLPLESILVHGGIEATYGQVTTVITGTGTSLHDLFCGAKEPASPLAIVGPCCAIIGALQALTILYNIWEQVSSESVWSSQHTLRQVLAIIDLLQGDLSYVPLE